MTQAQRFLLDIVKIAVELPIVFGLTFGGAWALARWAEDWEGRPVRAQSDGSIVLVVPKATLEGQLRFEPMVKEEQAGPFAYHFGRELDEERRGRRITHWSGPDDRAEWSFALDAPGEYVVEVELELPTASPSGQVSIALAGQSLSGTIGATGDSDGPRSISLGQIHLDTGPHALGLALAEVPSQTRLVRVVLRPVGAGEP